MPTRKDPVVARRRLRGSLRQAREKRGMTQKQVAEHLDWSHSKVVRIENGTVGVSTTDLLAMLSLYQVTDRGEVTRLVEVARTARRRAWYSKYANALDPGFDAYLSYESSADTLMFFQTLTIPGLLQTEEYARAVLEANDASYIEERLELRLDRQALLDREQRPFLLCVVDEAALRRQVGGPDVMYEQLIKLKDAANQARVSLEIVPFTSGAHPSMTESFTILHSDEWDEDVLFRESALQTVTTHEDRDLVAGYRVRFDLLRGMSLGEEEANVLIDSLIKDLSDAASPGRSG